jgi:hypothetical protein
MLNPLNAVSVSMDLTYYELKSLNNIEFQFISYYIKAIELLLL